jgi:uncharacterized protein (DUF779 family)
MRKIALSRLLIVAVMFMMLVMMACEEGGNNDGNQYRIYPTPTSSVGYSGVTQGVCRTIPIWDTNTNQWASRLECK